MRCPVRCPHLHATLPETKETGDQIDDDFDFLFDGDEDDFEPELPDYRATVTGGKLFMCAWWPSLIENGGPSGTLFGRPARAGITIANITMIRPDDARPEAVIELLTPGAPDEARRVLAEWGRATGLRRLWLGDELVDLGDEPPDTGTASVTCPTCKAKWADASSSFWVAVRNVGVFPTFCPLCGGDLPQWSLKSAERPVETKRRRDDSADARPGKASRPHTRSRG